MSLVAVQHQQTARPSVISLLDQARADKGDEKLKRRSLRRDRLNYVHIPLNLDAQHAAFVVILIQPLRFSEWPGCTFFAAAVEEIYRCCSAKDVQHLICKSVDRIIGRFYSQVTVNVPEALRKTRFYPFPEPCSLSPLALERISTEYESTITAQQLAERLTKKIRNGIQEIRTLLKSRNSLPHYFSGTAPTELGNVPRKICSSRASYNDIRQSFIDDGSEYEHEGDASRFRAWCSIFNAGSIDSIAHILPPRSVESSQAGEEHRQIDKYQQDSDRKTRKRRRDFSRLVNSVVYRLPGEPQIVYIALGVKHYQLSPQETLSSTQYNIITSIVVENLKEEDLTIPDNQERIYDPAQAISERAQLEPDIVSKALKDVSTLGKPTGTGENISTSTLLASGSDCSSSTLLQRFPNSSAQCSTSPSPISTTMSICEVSSGTATSSNTARIDRVDDILAAAAFQDHGSTVLTDRADQSTLAAAVSPGNKYQSGTDPKSGTEPPRKRPRLEEVHGRTADGVRAEHRFNTAYSQTSGDNLVYPRNTSDPSTVTNGHTPPPYDFPPVSETIHTMEHQDAIMAIQGTNLNSQDTLPMLDPSLEASGGNIDRMQSWPSDDLQHLGYNSTIQDRWGNIDSMQSWFTSDLIPMGFESI